MKHTIEVQSQEWAGTLRDGWRPAIDGCLNSYDMPAEQASEFDSLANALTFLPLIREQKSTTIRIVRELDGEVVHQEEL